MKLIIYLAIFLMLASLASAATMSRSMPDRVSPGESVSVTFSVSGMEIGKEVALSEILPSGWSVREWSVSGSEEAKADITYVRKTGNERQWSFTASTASPSITYTTIASNTAGTYEFDAVYMLPPANMDNLKKTVTVRVITCGDGVCEGSENSDNCEADCPKPTPPTPEPEKKFSWTGIIIAAAILVVGLVAYFIIKKKKK